MDSDDDFHNLDKYDKAAHKQKFDSDESDKDKREEQRMKAKLRAKQKKEQNKKQDDIDINQFIQGGGATTHDSDDEDTKGKKGKQPKMSKKEKRKMKKQQQMEAAKEEDEKQEEQPKKGGKKQKKQKGKKKMSMEAEGEDDDHQPDADEDKPEGEGEETKDEENKEEEKKGEESEDDFGGPKEMVYCQFCTVPPEYCSFVSQDLDQCKEFLQKEHPSVYGVVYEGREEEVKEESKGKKKKNKNIPKFKEFGKDTEVHIVKLKRGGKKMVTEIRGVDGFNLNLKDFSKTLGKKFACGNSLITDEATGEKVVQLLGDVDEDELMGAIQKDFPDVAKAKFKFEFGGSKKGRKKK